MNNVQNSSPIQVPVVPPLVLPDVVIPNVVIPSISEVVVTPSVAAVTPTPSVTEVVAAVVIDPSVDTNAFIINLLEVIKNKLSVTPVVSDVKQSDPVVTLLEGLKAQIEDFNSKISNIIKI